MGNLRYKIDWTYSWKANKEIMCHRTVFALFYFVFQGNFQVKAPAGLYSEGRLNRRRVFFALRVWEFIHGGGYFRNFTQFIHFNFPAVIPGIVVVITSLAQPDSYGLYKTKNSTEVL